MFSAPITLLLSLRTGSIHGSSSAFPSHLAYSGVTQKMKELNVVVVGAGIGGLQTSLALANDGHSVTLLESAKAFEEVRRRWDWSREILQRRFTDMQRSVQVFVSLLMPPDSAGRGEWISVR